MTDGRKETDPFEEARELTDQLTWSFDFAKLRSHMSGDDDLQVVVRGHLYLEHVLIIMLQEALIAPDQINIRDLRFPTKIALLSAMGILRRSLVAPLNISNRLRNRVAHALEITVSADDRSKFFESFQVEARALILEEPKTKVERTLEEVPLGHFFRVLTILTDLNLRDYRAYKIKRNAALKNARMVLEDE